MREVIYYCMISLDGYIADAQGSTSWMWGAPNEDYGFGEFYRAVGALALGRKTYEQMLDTGDFFPYADKPVYVFTSNPNLKRAADCVQIITDTDPVTFVARYKLKDSDGAPRASHSASESGALTLDAVSGSDVGRDAPGAPLWVGGGSRLASTLFAAGLIDEVCLHIQPVVLGAGLPFLQGEDLRRHGLDLQECVQAPGGFVRLRYRVVKSWRSDV